jgi:hypothetical protein
MATVTHQLLHERSITHRSVEEFMEDDKMEVQNPNLISGKLDHAFPENVLRPNFSFECVVNMQTFVEKKKGSFFRIICRKR